MPGGIWASSPGWLTGAVQPLAKIGAIMPGPDRPSGSDAGDLKERAAALRQASRLPQADPATLLDAALAELDGAVEALAEANGGAAGSAGPGRALSSLHSERRLLHAVFTAAPLPLYVVDIDGTVLRANSAACEVLGVGPGYATGKSLTALIEPAARAAVRSQLVAVARTGKPARLSCRMLASGGGAGQGPEARLPEGQSSAAQGGTEGVAVRAATRRLDALAGAARLLLEG